MKTVKEPRTFRLASTNMVSAPGILRWAMNGHKFKRDRAKMRNVMKSWETDLTDKESAAQLAERAAQAPLMRNRTTPSNPCG